MTTQDIVNYGKILCPAIKQNNIIHLDKEIEGVDIECGFLTESGDFVDNKDANEIAQFYSQTLYK